MGTFRKLTVGAMLLLALPLQLIFAADMTQLGPEIGKRFSNPLEAMDQSGKLRSLQSLMGERGVAVFFVRSADWCPFCRGQLLDANRRLQDFREQGLNVVSVSVDEVATLKAFATTHQIGYTMLADPKGAINLALGIRDESYPVGHAAFGVPRPVLYIIDREQIVRLRFLEPTFRTRPDLTRVLKEVQALRAKNQGSSKH